VYREENEMKWIEEIKKKKELIEWLFVKKPWILYADIEKLEELNKIYDDAFWHSLALCNQMIIDENKLDDRSQMSRWGMAAQHIVFSLAKIHGIDIQHLVFISSLNGIINVGRCSKKEFMEMEKCCLHDIYKHMCADAYLMLDGKKTE